MYNASFFQLLLQLEKSITSLNGSKTGTTLDDICFKPVSTCAVQTPLNYFQSNETLLNDAIEHDVYLDHVHNCSIKPMLVIDESALNASCLGSYGLVLHLDHLEIIIAVHTRRGPGLPNVVFGGYDAKNFSDATSFVITFIGEAAQRLVLHQAVVYLFLLPRNQ